MEPVSTSSRPHPPLPGSWPETRPQPDHPRGPIRKVLLDLTRLPAVPFLASPRLASPRYDLNGGTCIAIGGEGYCIVAASTRYVARRETRKKKTKRRDAGLPPLPWIFVLTNTSSSLSLLWLPGGTQALDRLQHPHRGQVHDPPGEQQVPHRERWVRRRQISAPQGSHFQVRPISLSLSLSLSPYSSVTASADLPVSPTHPPSWPLRSENYEHFHKKPMSCPAMAQMLGNTLYYKRFFPYYTFNLCAGLDDQGLGCVYTYDAIGSHERVGYSCQGSGKDLVQPVLDNQLKAPSILELPPKVSRRPTQRLRRVHTNPPRSPSLSDLVSPPPLPFVCLPLRWPFFVRRWR